MVKNRLFDILISLILERRLESTPKIFDSLEVHSRRLANNIMLHIKTAISIKLKLQLQTLWAEHPFCLKGDSRKDQGNHNTPARVMTEHLCKT